MSELQRYWAHHTSLETDLSRVRAIECNEVGDYYRAGDVDAARAADKARIEQLEAALRDIGQGPHQFIHNDEVAGWVAHIAWRALAGTQS